MPQKALVLVSFMTGNRQKICIKIQAQNVAILNKDFFNFFNGLEKYSDIKTFQRKLYKQVKGIRIDIVSTAG